MRRLLIARGRTVKGRLDPVTGAIAKREAREDAFGDDVLDELAEAVLVRGGDVHVVWEKFCRYFDVEPRIIPLDENKYTIGPDDVAVLPGYLDPVNPFPPALEWLRAESGTAAAGSSLAQPKP